MTDPQDPQATAVRDSFQSELNLHGYGFQFSVLGEAQRLAEARRSKWIFRVSEFPVQVQLNATKIDFILFRQSDQSWRADMICECKRANPATSNWCFVRSPYIARNYSKTADQVVLDSAVFSNNSMLRTYAKANSMTRNGYHIGLPVKTGAKGDTQPVKQSRSEIEDAASQVLRGTNGYLERLAADPQLVGAQEQESVVQIVPVIFTTANLFVATTNISRADLETGHIEIEPNEFQRISWLWYQYNVSPGIKHTSVPSEKSKKIEEFLLNEHMRSIAIVSPSGIEDFLTQTSEEL